ncbi:MAG: ATP-dependent DNA helicase [Salinispira sp.]
MSEPDARSEENQKQKQKQQLELEPLADMLLPGGGLSRLKPDDFEPRDAQLQMLEEVVKAFNDDRIVAVEAGTGVGKSLAYLIPAFDWVLKNEERVVISTATINLQHQIIGKDIPLVRSLFADMGGKDVKIALAKGRNQYLCRHRLNELIEEEGMFAEEQTDLIRQWADETSSGDRSDLSFNPNELLWSKINADRDSCPDSRCRDGCFINKARRNMAGARIIITNHHLLFADLSIRNEGFDFDSTVILPPFQRLILDEAHNIEGAATAYFSEELSRFHIYRYANRLLRKTRGREQGVIAHFRNEYAVPAAGMEEHLEKIRGHAADLDSSILPFLEDSPSFRLRAESESAPPDFQGAVSAPLRDALFSSLQTLQQSLLNCAEFLQDLYIDLSEHDTSAQQKSAQQKSAQQKSAQQKSAQQNNENPQSDTAAPLTAGTAAPLSADPRLAELRILIQRVKAAAGICGDFREFPNRPDLVYWLERRRTGAGDRFVYFTATPIEVGPLLSEVMFDLFPGIVLTSATLSVDHLINFWKQRIGLEENERVIFRSLDSPFDYPGRALLAVPGNAPDPSHSHYVPWLKDFIIRMLNVSEGHALVLFTSHKMLSDVYEYCKPILTGRGISCFRQGDDDRHRLMEQFRNDSSSVLFATHSFWEGIDAPGDTLKLLIICRLPFRVPNEPVLLARAEAVENRGGNSFLELSLPEAVMKLKQGFGRLMRSRNDRGAVIITDCRIVTKFYGRQFINSLPPARLVVGSEEKIGSELENILFLR